VPGAKGDSLGDMIVFCEPGEQCNRQDAGGYPTTATACAVVVGKSLECFWDAQLKDGMITIEGPFYDTGDSVFVSHGGRRASMPARRGR